MRYYHGRTNKNKYLLKWNNKIATIKWKECRSIESSYGYVYKLPSWRNMGTPVFGVISKQCRNCASDETAVSGKCQGTWSHAKVSRYYKALSHVIVVIYLKRYLTYWCLNVQSKALILLGRILGTSSQLRARFNPRI